MEPLHCTGKVGMWFLVTFSIISFKFTLEAFIAYYISVVNCTISSLAEVFQPCSLVNYP